MLQFVSHFPKWKSIPTRWIKPQPQTLTTWWSSAAVGEKQMAAEWQQKRNSLITAGLIFNKQTFKGLLNINSVVICYVLFTGKHKKLRGLSLDRLVYWTRFYQCYVTFFSSSSTSCLSATEILQSITVCTHFPFKHLTFDWKRLKDEVVKSVMICAD